MADIKDRLTEAGHKVADTAAAAGHPSRWERGHASRQATIYPQIEAVHPISPALITAASGTSLLAIQAQHKIAMILSTRSGNGMAVRNFCKSDLHFGLESRSCERR
jgi:hypothetical protein